MFDQSWKGSWQGVKPVGDTYTKARKVDRPTGTIMRGLFPSHKNGRMMEFEGLLERDAMVLFETSSKIVRYREQPLKIRYPDGNRLRVYTPDFELMLATGETILVEIKHHTHLEHEELRHKLHCIHEYFRGLQQPFHVLTDLAIRQQPRLANLNRICVELPRIWPTVTNLRSRIYQYQDLFPTSFEQAKSILSANQLPLSSLIVSGIATLDVHQPIEASTSIHLIKESMHESLWICKEYNF